MIFFHLTPRRNCESIERRGLLPAKARGDKRVWLFTGSNIHWAAHHLAAIHGCEPEDFELYRVSVPRSWVRKCGWRRGVWYTHRIVKPDKLAEVW